MFDAEEIVALVPREGITHAFFVPTMGVHILDALDRSDARWETLKLWCSAAAPLPATVRKRVLDRLPKTALWNVYGVTEAGVVSYLRQDDIARKPGTCVGKPYTGMEVRCVDPEGNAVGQGTVGEIVCRSPEAMAEYWGNPDATAAATRGGWVWSGDLGMFDEEGFLYVLDRVKDMVISGGENVYAAEVENAIVSCPGVVDVAVIGVPHDIWGEAVVAVVLANPGTSLVEQTVIDHAGGEIARYKCPKRVVIVDALERNSYGKVVKDVLRQTYAGLFAA
jgi:acyl-CoA synthetase (AMP-forming)/AMP-acid ligase II